MGDECGTTSSPGNDDLIIDKETGKQLSCGFGHGTEVFGPPLPNFLPGDRDQILRLAQRLATSDHGLSEDDKKQINDLVDKIAPGHGDNSDIVALADTGFIVGLIMLLGGLGVLGVINTEFRS